MPRQFSVQTNFSSGELDPTMRLRTDAGAFGNGAKTLTNVQLLNTGGGRRRDGTSYRATLGARSRLHHFEFDSDENYVFAFTSGSVAIYDLAGTLLATLSGSWNATTMWQMTFAQLGDVLLVFHQSFVPRKITRTGLTSFIDGNFAFRAALDGSQSQQPFYKFVDDTVTMKTSNETGPVTITCSTAFFTPARVGTYIRIHGTPVLITGYTSATVATGTVEGVIKPRLDPDPIRTSKGAGQINITIPLHGLVPNQPLTLSGANDVGGITAAQINTTFAARTGTSNPGEWYLKDANTIRVFTAGVATLSTDGGGASVQYVVDNQATRNWDEQVFNAINGWPACGCFHQERLFLAGSPELPAGLWGSEVGQYFSFDLGTAKDSEGIFIIAGQENGVAIRHLVSGKHLQIFSEVGEFYVPRMDGQAITPLNMIVDKQTPYGSLDVAPISLDGATIFLQKSKTAVREFIYSDAERSYNANPLSLAASHMLNSPVDLGVLYGNRARPEQYAFLVNGDGTMAVFYSARVERLAGWSRWTTATGHKIHSVAVAAGRVYLCAERAGAFFLEEVASTTELTLDGATEFTNGSAISVWSSLPSRYYGKTVSVLARDDAGQITAALGTFTVSGSGVLTLTGAQKNIVVGYDYPFVIETLPPHLASQQGPLEGEIKRIAQVQVGLQASMALTVQGQPLDFTLLNDDTSQPPARFTGYQTVSILGYAKEPTIVLTQNAPLPLTVLGLVMKVSV